ncbi:MAG: type III pantothenate kinase [Methylophilaceae bacterium]|nr:type III pantothenate kinase [Methylophilaceae bacterium]
MLLAIDSGNTRTKWAVFDSLGSIKAQGVCTNTDLNAMAIPTIWHACQRITISNVAGTLIAAILNKLLRPLKIPIRWIVASVQACGLENSYANPAQLGTDRWAAMIAAWQQFQKPCIVVNAGTALTVDAISAERSENHGIFLGGIIMPGLMLMQNSLILGAADISGHAGSFQDFPTSTGTAVYTGALTAMAGAVETMFYKLQQLVDSAPLCIINGGDAASLATILNKKMENHLVVTDNLVLQGLLFLEREAP